jgi:arylsulfatase A-like enzyme
MLSATSVAQPPNIVVIVADDLGWKDVGFNGSEINTPHLDALAAGGVTLTDFYVQPTCSPTRAALMTGQSPLRHGIDFAIGKNSEGSLPLSLTILPQYLAEAGYQSVMVGKWHLGHATTAMLPMARGFEQVYGHYTGGVGYWDHVHGGGLDWHRNGKTLREEGYATHLQGDEAVRLIRERDRQRPLFLYTAFSAPHLPNEAPAERIADYADITDEKRRVHAAMVDELDRAIGRIVATLEEEQMLDNTLLWFFSDNGGLNPGASPDALRSLIPAQHTGRRRGQRPLPPRQDLGIPGRHSRAVGAVLAGHAGPVLRGFPGHGAGRAADPGQDRRRRTTAGPVARWQRSLGRNHR